MCHQALRETPPLRTNLSLESSGGPYPRPLICRGPRPAGVAGISILGFQILKESRQAKRLGTEMIEDSVRFDLLIIFRKEDYR